MAINPAARAPAPVAAKPPTSPGGVPLVQIENPDYVVQNKDTMWMVAEALVKERGEKPTGPAVTKALKELEAINPELFTEARKHGGRIFPGDQVRFPPKEGGWKFGESTRPQPTQTEAEVAQGQMERLRQEAAEQHQRMRDNRESTLIRYAEFASKNELTPTQKETVLDYLQEVQAEAPDMLQFPHVRDLADRVGFKPTGDVAEVGPVPPKLSETMRNEVLAEMGSVLEQLLGGKLSLQQGTTYVESVRKADPSLLETDVGRKLEEALRTDK